MRIMILVTKLSGGGAERVASLWANGFSDLGYSVSVVLNSKTMNADYKVKENVKVYNIYNWLGMKLSNRFDCNYIMILLLRRIMLKVNPDVVIGVQGKWAEWAYWASKGLKVKVVNTEHNSFERPINRPLPKAEWKRKYKLNKKYDHVTVLTEADKCCIQDMNNVSVLPNPLAFSPVKSIPPKECVILAAGRLSAWYVKGFDVLLKAWEKIASDFPEWKLRIAGADRNNALEKLQSLVDKSISNQIEFLGYQQNMIKLYQQASIFVLSSRYEGFGMVLIEAMSQGCAPIACDYKGRQCEIVTSELEGIICQKDDVEALAGAMRKMIEDEQYRSMVQLNAIKRSYYFSLEETMNRWKCIFNKMTIKKND